MTANNDFYITDENFTVNGDVRDNDTDNTTIVAVNGNGALVGVPISVGGDATLTVNANGTFTFNPGTFYDNLAVGDQAFYAFTYEDEDGSIATVSFTINGTNDVPVVSVHTDSVVEDATVNGNVPAATDVDDGATIVSYELTAAPPTGLTFNPDGSYSFDASSYDSLEDGETLDIVVSYTATDDQGGVSDPQTLTITITGTNDAPVATAGSNSVDEDDSTSGNVSVTDVDDAIASYTLVGEGPTGLSFNPVDGSYTFDASSYDSLADGETLDVTFDFYATDAFGADSNTETVTITITGTNDAPVAFDGTNSVTEDGSTSGSVSVTDVDDAIASYTLVGEGPTGLSFNTGDGTYTFDAASYDSLADGETLDVTFDFYATDAFGADSNTETVTITITGTNDAPVAVASTNSVDEDSTVNGNVSAGSDVDGTIASYQLTAAAPTGLTFNTDGSYSFDASGYDSLSVGEEFDLVVNYTATDNDGGVSAPTTLTITITGTNDTPVAVASTGSVDEDATLNSTVVSATDVDGSIASYQLTAAAPTGLTFNTDGSYSFDASSYDSLADGEEFDVVVNYTATDNDGGVSAPTTLTITITGTNDTPVAVASTGSVDEDATLNSTVVSATDVDGSIASYQLTAAAPTGLTFNTDGSYSFDASSYDSLADGEEFDVVVNYTATDNDGGVSAPTTLTITITGTNDAPVAVASTGSVDEDATLNSTVVSATDVDGSIASYQLTEEAPTGLTFNTDGTYSFDASSYDSLGVGDELDIVVNYTATDNDGGVSAPTTLTITITGTNDIPVVTAATGATTEGYATSGNVPAATDVDGSVTFYELTDAAPAGLVFNSDGSWTFDGSGFDSLAQGETDTLVVNYIGIDNDGGESAPQTLTITITGIAGTSGNDTIIGTAGNDTFDGGQGTDNIYGREGDDTFIGTVDGVGDAYRGEGGSDTVDYSGATGAMNINLNNAASGGGVGTDQLYDIENAIGTAFGDTMSGNASANRITGGLGNDTVNGNGGIDTVVINANAANGIAVQGSFNLTVTTADGADLVRNVEFLQFNNALIQVNGLTGNAHAYGVGDLNTATEDGAAATGNVLTNDIEIEGETISVSGGGVFVGDHGTLTINADGTYSYVATNQSLADGEVVSDVFTYTVIDSAGEGSTASLGFTVTGTNDAPIASDGTNDAFEDDMITGSVSASDVDGDTLTYALLGENPDGLALNTDGTYTFDASSYELNAGETQDVTFSFTVSDGEGGTDTGSYTITVTGINDAPVAVDATDSVDEDSTVNGAVSASDIDGTVASFQLVGAAPTGLTFNTDGTYSFDASSYDSVALGDTLDVVATFTATDDQGGVSAPQTLTITITGSNDAPVVSQADFSVDEDDSVSGSVSGSDVDGTVDSYQLVGMAPAGLTFNTDGSYSFDASSYELAGGDSDEVSFTFTGTDNDGGVSDPVTVTITVNGVNDAPVAVDATDSVDEDSSVNGAVSASDVDGTIASYQLTGEVPDGLILNTDGTYSFDASSYDSVALGDTLDVVATFTATDDQGAVSAPRTLTITITGSNDAPVVSQADFEIDEDDSVSGSVSGSDVDGTVDSYQLVGMAPTGLTFNTDGSYSFDASSYDSLNGGDSQDVTFTFTGTDNSGGVSDPVTVTITINGVNDAPVAVDATDSVDEDGSINGAVSASDEDGTIVSFQLTDEAPEGLTFNTDGTYSFDASSYDNLADGEEFDVVATFTATDDQGQVSAPQTLTITITGSNDAPVVSQADFEIDEGDSVSGSVSGSDVDGTVDSYQLVGMAPTGLTFNTDGSYSFDASSYELAGGASQDVTFTFTGTDNDGGVSDPVTVTITVNGVNDVPVAVDVTDSVDEDGSINGAVSASDVDGTIASFQLTGPAPEGLTFNTDGTYSFDASSYDSLAEGEEFDVVVSYTATDAQGGVSAPQTLTITITGSNDAPVVSQADFEIDEDDSVTGSVSGSDVDGTVDSYQLVGEAPTGLTFNTDGSYSFDASSYDSLGGSDSTDVSFTFTGTDNDGSVSDPVTVTITVNGVNDAPVAVDATDSVDEDGSINGAVSASDVDGTIASYQLTGEAPAGLTFNTDGTYSFDASSYDNLAEGEEFDVVVSFTATDAEGGVSAPQTLTITITGSNDAPVVSQADFEIDEDDSVTGSVSGSDVDGTVDSYQLVGEAPTGLTFNTDGSYSFDASSYDSLGGSDSTDVSFTFTGTDNDGSVSDPVTVTITVNGVNDAPVAVDATDSVDEDGSINGAVSASDVDGTIASYQLTGEGPEGLTFNTDGSYSFDASSYDNLAEGEEFDVVATFTATDAEGGVSAPQTLTITITGSNDAPVVSQADFEIDEDDSVTGSVSGSDVDGTVDSYQLVGEAPTGLTFNTDGSYSFDASSYDSLGGADSQEVSFTFTGTDNDGSVSDPVTVTITVNGVNDAPEAVDATGSVDEDGSITGSVSASDVDGTIASYQLTDEAPEGLTFNTDGTYSFDASSYDSLAEGEEFDVVVSFTATDAEGGVSAPQTLTITITGSNDAPVVSGADFSIEEDDSVTGSVSGSDVDGTVASYQLVGEAPTGLTFNTDGSYSFDASSYDSIAAGDSQEVSFTFTGTDNDGSVSDPVTVTITIDGVNDAPVASDTNDFVDEDDSITGSVSAGDVDGTVVSYQLTGEAPTGLTFNTDGSYSFDASSYDYLSFDEDLDVVATFTVTDDQGAVSEERTLTITITGSNDAPVVSGDDFSVDEGDVVIGSVSGSDVDGTVVTYQVVGATPTGLTFNADGSYSFNSSSYDSNFGQSQEVSFTFTGTDNNGDVSEPDTVTITVFGQTNDVVLDDGGDSYTGTSTDDDVTGGDGDDTINAGGGINNVNGGDGDDFIVTGGGEDTINGEDGDDTIIAGSGNDIIDGGEGNDDVNAGSGNDIVYSGAGDDILRGGTGSDTISFENTGAGVVINLGNTGFQTTVDGTDQYLGFENVIGTDFNDSLTGNASVNQLAGGDGDDVLNGGLGADTLIGGDGDDSYYTDAGDTVIEQADGGTDRVITTAASFTLSANVENLFGQASTGQTLTGNDLDNIIFGGAGDDILNGGLGADYLIGGQGNDILIGGSGLANSLQGGAGNDTYFVTENDTVTEFANEGIDSVVTTRASYSLSANVENLFGQLSTGQTLTGNDLDNSIIGAGGADILTGGRGNDYLNGGDGSDTARLSGVSSGYSITVEGSGYRVTDTFLDDGDDGSDFLLNIETLMFGNGSTMTLTPPAPAPLAPSSKESFGAAVVLPGLADDDFIVSSKDTGPEVMPSSDGFGDVMFGSLSLAQVTFEETILVRDGFMLELLPIDGALVSDNGRYDDWMM